MINELWLIGGISLLVFTIYNLSELLRSLQKKQSDYIWKLVSLILSVFLTGFSLYTYYFLRFKDIDQRISLFVLLYFISAIFVLIVIRRSYNLIESLKENEKEYLNLNLKLEYEAKQKTDELAYKVAELEDSRTAMINILEDVNLQKDEIEESKLIVDRLNRNLKKSNIGLLALDKQKDQFTSIAAHELKTPLASIKGFVQLLQNKNIFEDKKKRESYMNIILQDSDRLARLITDILDISRMDLGTLKFHFETIKTKELFEKVKSEMGPIIGAKKIKASYPIGKDAPKALYCDLGRTLQVITNLVNNAVHYTEEGGKIAVSIKSKGRGALFSVSDTGIGIPRKQLKRIFERFFQVDSWLTRKIGGSGLGLSICKGIVGAMGGRIGVNSEEGKGSTFYFTLPLKKVRLKDAYEKYITLFEEAPDKKIKVEEEF